MNGTGIGIAVGTIAYTGVMVGLWVKIAADYKYDMIRNPEWRHRGLREQATFHAGMASVWPVWGIILAAIVAFDSFVSRAGKLGERRVEREDAAVEALKQQAVDVKRTRDMFERGSDEWLLLNGLAEEARTRWQEASK